MRDKIEKNLPSVVFGLTLLIFLLVAWLLRRQLYCIVQDPGNQNSLALLVFLIPSVAGFIGGVLLPKYKAILGAVGCGVAAALVVIIVLILMWPPLPKEDCFTPTATATPCFIIVEIDLEGVDASVEATLQVGQDVYRGTQTGSGTLAFRVPCDYIGQRADLSVEAAGYARAQQSIKVTENPLSRPIALVPMPTIIAVVTATCTATSMAVLPTDTPRPTATATPAATSSPAPSPPTATLTPTPTHTATPTSMPAPLVIADFERGDNINNLGGEMGAAFEAPDLLNVSYPVRLSDGGSMVRLEYDIQAWSAFWLKLRMLDLSPYRWLSFDIRSDLPAPSGIKVELHQACTTVGDRTTCERSEARYVSGITGTWQTIRVPLSEFAPVPGFDPLESWMDMQELVFAFERDVSGQQGVVYLDNIELWK